MLHHSIQRLLVRVLLNWPFWPLNRKYRWTATKVELCHFELPVISNSKSFPLDMPYNYLLYAVSNSRDFALFFVPLRVQNSAPLLVYVQNYVRDKQTLVTYQLTSRDDLVSSLTQTVYRPATRTSLMQLMKQSVN